MENLSFDEGLKSYKINGDSNRVLRFNPGDINILTRYKEVVTNLEKISDNLPEANINADGTPADNADIVSAQLEAFDNELKKGDAITDIAEDMAAEQKARSTYDNLLRLCRDDPDVYEPLKFLREREVVHFQRFGEAMSIIQSKLDSKNFYAYNPEFKK